MPSRRSVSRMNVGQILEPHLGWACGGPWRSRVGADRRRAISAVTDAKALTQEASIDIAVARDAERTKTRRGRLVLVEIGERPASRRTDRNTGLRWRA